MMACRQRYTRPAVGGPRVGRGRGGTGVGRGRGGTGENRGDSERMGVMRG